MQHERKLETHFRVKRRKTEAPRRNDLSCTVHVRMFVLGHSNWLITIQGRQATYLEKVCFVQVSRCPFEMFLTGFVRTLFNYAFPFGASRGRHSNFDVVGANLRVSII